MTYFELSKSDAVLTFVPHYNGETASFDIGTANESIGDWTMPPDFARKGHHICSNIDRATARALRDALAAWLAGGAA